MDLMVKILQEGMEKLKKTQLRHGRGGGGQDFRKGPQIEGLSPSIMAKLQWINHMVSCSPTIHHERPFNEMKCCRSMLESSAMTFLLVSTWRWGVGEAACNSPKIQMSGVCGRAKWICSFHFYNAPVQELQLSFLLNNYRNVFFNQIPS